MTKEEVDRLEQEQTDAITRHGRWEVAYKTVIDLRAYWDGTTDSYDQTRALITAQMEKAQRDAQKAGKDYESAALALTTEPAIDKLAEGLFRT